MKNEEGFCLANTELFTQRKKIRKSGRSALEIYHGINKKLDPNFSKVSEVQKNFLKK